MAITYGPKKTTIPLGNPKRMIVKLTTKRISLQPDYSFF